MSFSLQQDEQQLRTSLGSATPTTDGIYPARIIEVIEVGLVPGFSSEDEPYEQIGITFQLQHGKQVCKLMKMSSYSTSTLMSITHACLKDDNSEITEVKHLLNATIDLEILADPRFPKIVGYSHPSDGLSTEDAPAAFEDPTYYDMNDTDNNMTKRPGILRGIHQPIRSAISQRIRVRED